MFIHIHHLRYAGAHPAGGRPRAAGPQHHPVHQVVAHTLSAGDRRRVGIRNKQKSVDMCGFHAILSSFRTTQEEAPELADKMAPEQAAAPGQAPLRGTRGRRPGHRVRRAVVGAVSRVGVLALDGYAVVAVGAGGAAHGSGLLWCVRPLYGRR